jgi:membrane-bound metal-dependent hydrolase YbcI (DUF457 family)
MMIRLVQNGIIVVMMLAGFSIKLIAVIVVMYGRLIQPVNICREKALLLILPVDKLNGTIIRTYLCRILLLVTLVMFMQLA